MNIVEQVTRKGTISVQCVEVNLVMRVRIVEQGIRKRQNIADTVVILY